MASPAPTLRRLRIEIRGAVQGVGFRPFVFRAATEAGLRGWVVNDLDGVCIEVEGASEELDDFVQAVRWGAPTNAVVRDLQTTWLQPEGAEDFTIRESDRGGALSVTVLPDLATCPACTSDVLDPSNRRHAYPFTNCTDCGPRFSIVRDLPYDRPLTGMKGFEMCESCLREYEDPRDRRFHAQPNACPDCGPRVSFVTMGRAAMGRASNGADPAGDAICRAADAILGGRVVAVKGLGGFHLVCDATNEAAVRRLRTRKRRPTRPLAVMVPDLETAHTLCSVSSEAEELLTSPAAPIVLLDRLAGPPDDSVKIAPSVAPGASRLGLFLPYTPLHHLLLQEVGGPVVATSGNFSNEPICIDNDEAALRLAGIADDVLLHDRPIERPVDDSVVMEIGCGPSVVRRSRGYAPMPIGLANDVPSILAVGGQQKTTVALARGREAWMGSHIGNLDTIEAQEAFRRSVSDLRRLYRVDPEVIAHDLHLDYASTRWAIESAGGSRLVPVQHHHAHLASLLAEHGRPADTEPVLGVIWDGTGLGTDGTIWGGEFLLGNAVGFERVAHLRTFRLPGGEAAIREPRRVALALLVEAGLDPIRLDLPFDRIELFRRMVENGISSPVTSSAGRLFDGVSAILGLCGEMSYEGEAAVRLEEAAATERPDVEPLPFPLVDVPLDASPGDSVRADGPPPTSLVVDWVPAIRALVHELDRGVPVPRLSARFHAGLTNAAVRVAQRVGSPTVALSGGCMQNVRLVRSLRFSMDEAGFRPLMHRTVPANDGGLALGQVVVAAAQLDSKPSRSRV